MLKIYNYLRDNQVGEFISIIFIFISFIFSLFIKINNIFIILFLFGFAVMLTCGFIKKMILPYFSLSISYFIIGGIIYFLCINPEYFSNLLKTEISLSDLPLLWKIWLGFILLVLLVFVYEAAIKKNMTLTKDLSYVGNSLLALLFQVLVFITFLLVLFKSFEFLAFNTVVEGKKYDFTLQIIALLFTFISVVIAGGYFLIQKRIGKIDRLEELLREVDELLSYSASLVVSGLPSFSTTQHIPYKDYKILGELADLYEKSIHFKTQIEKKPHVSSKVYIALGLYYYGKGDYRCVNYLEKISSEHEKTGCIEKEIYSLALWRLGIAFLAHFNNIEKSRSYWKKMYTELPEYAQIQGRTAEALSYIAEYRRKYNSRFWKTDMVYADGFLDTPYENLLKLKNELLTKHKIKDLFISWYFLNIAYEMGGDKFVVANIIDDINFVSGKLIETYNKTSDYAIKANYAMSIEMLKIMCATLALNTNQAWMDSNIHWFNVNWKDKIKTFANQIIYEHPHYDFVASEKEISEVTVREFLKHTEQILD